MEFDPNPIALFKKLYARVYDPEMAESAAVTLATATPDGQPSVRVVLLKDVDDRGFVFYTNLASRKARELKANPHAALCFYWEPIHYQVRVEGTVSEVSESEADAYFATRPRGSQIGAWASMQSEPLSSREQLEALFKKYEQEFRGRTVPRPPFWSGFVIVPERMEFWLRRENRLHERRMYVREGDAWRNFLLYP